MDEGFSLPDDGAHNTGRREDEVWLWRLVRDGKLTRQGVGLDITGAGSVRD